MDVKNILITGDDGYNSIGTRLLIHFLKNEYELTICATKTQQSGIGGKMNLNEEIAWHETKVDGIKAVWVDSTPVDAVEFAKCYYNKKFDFAVSGINLGANVSGGAMISSGTVAAATRILSLGLSSNVMSVGWDLPTEYWFRNHSEEDDISPYINYPGETMHKLIKKIIENNFWGSELLNINFPEKPTNKAIFTQPLADKGKFYLSPLLDGETSTFTYSSKPKEIKFPINTDAGAIQHSLISITPCKSNMLNDKLYNKLKGNNFVL